MPRHAAAMTRAERGDGALAVGLAERDEPHAGGDEVGGEGVEIGGERRRQGDAVRRARDADGDRQRHVAAMRAGARASSAGCGQAARVVARKAAPWASLSSAVSARAAPGGGELGDLVERARSAAAAARQAAAKQHGVAPPGAPRRSPSTQWRRPSRSRDHPGLDRIFEAMAVAEGAGRDSPARARSSGDRARALNAVMVHAPCHRVMVVTRRARRGRDRRRAPG